MSDDALKAMQDAQAEPAPEKRGPGRPKRPEAKAEPKASPKRRMKAEPNWEAFDMNSDETPDRLRIPKHLLPDDYDFQWVTESVYGMPMPQRRGMFERTGGWTAVSQEDFEGRFDGLFMKKGEEGEIKVDGLVLMARPIQFTIKARQREQQEAVSRVRTKEHAMLSGDMNSPLDPRHKTALSYNKINRSYERIEVPKEPDKE